MRKKIVFFLFLFFSFSFSLENQRLIIEKPLSVSEEKYPQEENVSFMVHEGIFRRLLILPHWKVEKEGVGRGYRLEMRMRFIGPVSRPRCQWFFLLKDENNFSLYSTNMESDIKYELFDIMDIISEEVAHVLGRDISERGLLIIQIPPSLGIGGRVKLQDNVLFTITHGEGSEERVFLLANQVYTLVWEDRFGKVLYKTKVKIQRGEEKIVRFDSRSSPREVGMGVGLYAIGPLKNTALQEEAKIVSLDSRYWITKNRWLFDLSLRFMLLSYWQTEESSTVTTGTQMNALISEVLVGTSFFQRVIGDSFFLRFRVMTGGGLYGKNLHLNTLMYAGGVVMGKKSFLCLDVIGVETSFPAYFHDNAFVSLGMSISFGIFF